MTATTPSSPAVPAGRERHASGALAAVRGAHLLSVATAVAVLIGIVIAFGRDYHPMGDLALPELFIRQMPHSLPLVGPYSLGRGFSHPSPLFFYLAAVPYALSGDRSSALLATSLLVNGGALVAGVWLAERRRAPGLGIALLACVALTGIGHDSSFIDLPWNPYVAAIPFVTLVVAAWSIWAGGSRWTIPWIVALGAWCVGAHMAFAVPVIGVGLIAATAAVLAVRRDRWTLRSLVAPVLTAVGLGIALWAPTIVDLVRNGTDGNTAAIWRFVTDPPIPRVPLNEAANVLSSELSLRPYWAGGHRPAMALGYPGHASWPFGLLLVVTALGFALRRRATPEVAGVLVSLAGLLAAFAGTALTHSPDLLSWYVLPADMAGVALAAFTFWSLGCTVGHWLRARPEGARTARYALVALGVLAVGAATVRMATADDTELQRAVGKATSAMTPQLVRRYGIDRPLRVGNVVATREPQAALVLDLAKAGVPVTVPSIDEDRFGPWWSRPAPDAVHLVVTPRAQPPDDPDRRLVAVSPPTPFMLGGPRRMAVWEVPADGAG